MAAYHFRAKPISRSKGQSAVHTAAYNARDQLFDEREGRQTKDYSKWGETLFSGIFAPKGAPAWAQDRGELWNRAEAAEKRVDAQTARNVEFALPHELSQEQRERLVKDYVRETFARRGMVADVSMHAPDPDGDPRNFHVHCLLTLRKIEGEEFAATKCREWNGKAELEEWREKLAHMGARALDRAGFAVEAERFRHGHQTIGEQRAAALERGDTEFAATLDREPTRHKGVTVTAMERRGLDPDRTAAAREAKEVEASIRQTESDLATARAEQGRQAPEAAQEMDERQARRAARAAAASYSDAGMASQQRDALRHHAERQRRAEERHRQQAQGQEPAPPSGPSATQQPAPEAQAAADRTAAGEAKARSYRERMSESQAHQPAGPARGDEGQGRTR